MKWYRFDFGYMENNKDDDFGEHYVGRYSFGEAENEAEAEKLFWDSYKPLHLRKLKLHHVTEIDFVPKIGVIGKKVQE